MSSKYPNSYKEFMENWDNILIPFMSAFIHACAMEEKDGITITVNNSTGSATVALNLTHFNNIPIEDYDNDDGNVDT